MSVTERYSFRPQQQSEAAFSFQLPSKKTSGQPKEQRVQRQAQFQKALALVDQIEDIFKGAQSKVYQELSSFVAKPVLQTRANKLHQIPCAILLSGFNCHMQLNHLEHSGFIAHLNAKQTLKQMLSSIVKQFISCRPAELDSIDTQHQGMLQENQEKIDDNWNEYSDNEEFGPEFGLEDINQGETDFSALLKSRKQKTSGFNFDLSILLEWYPKICSTLGSRPNLVITLNQFEFFDKKAICDVLTHISQYAQRLPFVLLIGLSSSMDSLFQSLPYKSITMLSITKFHIESTYASIDSIVQELFINRVQGLKLSGRVFRSIIESFRGFNQSIKTVMKSVRYALMDHFYGNPLSLLTQLDIMDESYDTIADLIDPDFLLEIKMLPSLQRELDILSNSYPDLVFEILNDNEALKTKVLEYTLALENYHFRYNAGMKVLLELQNMFAAKKSLTLLYLHCLEQDIVETETVKHNLILLGKFDISKMTKFLNAAKGALDLIDDEHGICATDSKKLQELIDGLEIFKDLDDDASEVDASVEEMDYILKFGKKRQADITPEKIAKQRTSFVSTKLKPKEYDISTFEGHRQLITTWFSAFFKYAYLAYSRNLYNSDTLKNYRTQPLHEIIYYDNPGRIKKAFTPQPRAAIQTALNVPAHYLSLKDTNALSDTHSDVCILYSLHLECGKLINLADLWTAFKTAVNGDEKEVFARFMKSVAELERCGFVKSTNMKTDHLSRLTWGAM